MSFPLLPPPAELTHSSNLRAMSVDAMAEKLCAGAQQKCTKNSTLGWPCAMVHGGHSDPPEKLHGQARLGRNAAWSQDACPRGVLGSRDMASISTEVFAALVACFMGATDGLSLGALPKSPRVRFYPDFQEQH